MRGHVLYAVLRRILFVFDAETAHRMAMFALGIASALPVLCRLLRRWFAVSDPLLRVRALGIDFDSPIGLAAGLDKDAIAVPALSALGFGFVEVGTLTARPQPGNARPRLFRLPRDRALVNRMGFNNEGAAAAARRLSRIRDVVVGANIGRGKLTPNEAAVSDYVESARMLAPHVAYLVINVSSPNTPELRALQTAEHLRPLVAGVQRALREAAPSRRVPLLVKVAPDLSDGQIDEIAELSLELELAGIIATNTTTERAGLAADAFGGGGLSGAPLRERSLAVLRRLRAKVGDRLVLVASGGIDSAAVAWERILAGATLVQLYSGLVYEGPSLPGRIARGLVERARTAGLTSVSEAIGREREFGPVPRTPSQTDPH